MSEFEDWITTAEAVDLTGYSLRYVQRLIHNGRVRARKWARVWMIHRAELLDYKEHMDGLGRERHNPWRSDLQNQGRGRYKDDLTDNENNNGGE